MPGVKRQSTAKIRYNKLNLVLLNLKKLKILLHRKFTNFRNSINYKINIRGGNTEYSIQNDI